MPLSQEEITQLVEALKPVITEVASEAAAAHVTKRNKGFEDNIVNPLKQRLESFNKPQQSDEEPEKITLTQKVNKLIEDNQRLEKKLKDEKENGMRKSMRSTLESEFAKRNLSPHQIKALAAQMIHDDKLVDIDQDGNAIFKVAGSYNNETVSLQEGLDSFFKGDGKTWLPTPQGRGTGQRPIKSNSTIIEADSSQEEKDAALIEGIRRLR